MIKATYYWACPRQPRVATGKGGGEAYLFKACFILNKFICKNIKLQTEKIFLAANYMKN
jgi:hypothetical protein